jgi:hypothetical protein
LLPGGVPPDPLGYGYTSAKQNYAFCFFFWKKKNIARRIDTVSVTVGCGILLFPEKEAKSVVLLRRR